MDRYGFYGEVSYMNQNRFRPYSIAGLGSLQPVLSGQYRGQPGRLLMPQQRPSRELDRALFRSLDVQLAGPGFGATDREICSALTTAGGGILSAASGAFGPQPVRRVGETQTAYETRLREWQIATRTTTVAGNVTSSASALCNLIDQADQPAPSSPTNTANDWELMAARAELQRLYAQAGSPPAPGISNQTLMLIGGGIAIAAIAYLLLK